MSKKLALALVIVATACGGGEGTIAGTITGASGPLLNAAVTAAGQTENTAADGTYEITGVEAGSVAVTVAADWYTGGSATTEVESGKTANVDLQLTAAPLVAEAADVALASTFNANADWTSDAVSIGYVTEPTRALFELAIHYRNPALYRDPGSEGTVTPPMLPTIATPATFDFEVGSGAQQGEQALLNATVVDDVSTVAAGTPDDGVVLWGPALHYLVNGWSMTDATPLYTAGVAVRQQKWDGTSMLPTQEIERVHLHDGGIWVEVVFQDFVELGDDITDADGDGLREIWAQINPVHFDATLYAELRDVYVAETHDTLELAEILGENLDALYSRGTNANLISTTGVPYTHPDLGTVEYPFAVVLHGTVAVANVFLIAP